jgi:cyclic dehypoxanthinyl futalosine synthase
MREEAILEKVKAGVRMDNQEALYLLEHGTWAKMAEAAFQVRNRMLTPGVVSYTAFRVVNYTNVCDVDCSFCSFKDEVDSKRAYTLSKAEVAEKALGAKELGADQIFFQGGVNIHLPLDYYTDVLSMLSGPDFNMHVRGFSPVELFRIAAKEGLSVRELVRILKQAGLGSVPGAGAEILTENMRQQLSPKKLSAAQWCEVMGICHEEGLPGSANIVFGSTETPQDIIEHLNYIRTQQDLTGGFLTFIPWVFQPQTKNFTLRHVPGHEYLKVLALARLYFDNIQHIEVSVMVMGKELSEVALYSGADDINSFVIEENVLRSAGLRTLRAAERFISEAGFTPRRRSLNFNRDYK